MFAYAGLFGMDVEAMLCGNQFDFRVREHIVKRALDLRRMMDDNQAVAIVNKLAESMKKASG